MLVLAVAALAWMSPTVQDVLLRSFVARVMDRSAAARLLDPDALRVLVCGSASPMPHPSRRKACVAVFAGGAFYVVDTGPGAWNNLGRWGVPGARIGAILLTHYHSDHVGGLGEFNMQTWVAGRPGPLRVFGPPGVRRVVAGFMEAYALDTDYRIAHHGEALLPRERAAMEAVSFLLPSGRVANEGKTLVLEQGGLQVTAFAVDHDPIKPAVGYRFDYRGRSVVVSGDTVKDERLVRQARGADVLVHEAQANHMVGLIRDLASDRGQDRIVTIMDDIPSYHTTPVQAAEAANEAGVALLVLYHLTPAPPNALAERVFMRGVSEVRPDGVLVADDGTLVELPVGGSEIVVSSLD